MSTNVLSVGSLVSITSYGPYFGCTGIIRSIDVIAAETQDPWPFYLVALRESQGSEPLWFEHDAVVEVVGNHAFSDFLPGR